MAYPLAYRWCGKTLALLQIFQRFPWDCLTNDFSCTNLAYTFRSRFLNLLIEPGNLGRERRIITYTQLWANIIISALLIARLFQISPIVALFLHSCYCVTGRGKTSSLSASELGFNFLQKPHHGHLLQFILWLATWAGKMNQIMRCDWVPHRARWRTSRWVPQGKFRQKLLLTTASLFGQDGWILTSFFFCVFMDRDGVEVH